MSASYISSFDHLRTWFMDAGTPKFTIAHGNNFDSRRYAFSQTDPAMDIEEAYELLEERLRLFGSNGGTFVVNLSTKNGGNGWKTLFKIEGAGKSGISGIGSAGGFYLGEKRVEDYIAEKISDKMENFELRRKLEDLEAAIENQGSFFERIINRVTEHPNFDPTLVADKLIDGIGAIFLRGNSTNKTSVGLSGFPAGNVRPETPASTADDVEGQGVRIAQALQRLADAFPEHDLGDLLTGLADYIENNPGMAQMLLGQIMKK